LIERVDARSSRSVSTTVRNPLSDIVIAFAGIERRHLEHPRRVRDGRGLHAGVHVLHYHRGAGTTALPASTAVPENADFVVPPGPAAGLVSPTMAIVTSVIRRTDLPIVPPSPRVQPRGAKRACSAHAPFSPTNFRRWAYDSVRVSG
jgi:hypothetical protein